MRSNIRQALRFILASFVDRRVLGSLCGEVMLTHCVLSKPEYYNAMMRFDNFSHVCKIICFLYFETYFCVFIFVQTPG